ncbi:tetraacyldisaccharide 4'-kinase [Paludibacter sp. 221]|uniref:tetraacyldisaccharide 4'-kinase n=1 Tax=Paludibacter sp. 221 TaxID=2302939 RepID=UPI0013D7848F|nr:tetraacyldisaccharide 4'-kinase [Paludibacter sp. 221]NDV47305.1 tetraacyldisaccharide 4'-kinase [Paludibacter sp. 221]
MAKLKYIVLYPFSLLYGLVSKIRNILFDKDILRSEEFDIPIISVGNLAVGGTGKTPHTEYILSFLQNKWKTAMLSRGYKRKTKGFRPANASANANTIGDEPFQIHQKFPDVTVAVCEKRVQGVSKLLELYPDLQAVVLDDAFQHRHIKAGFSILLTDYSRLYIDDFYLPSGRLRESKKGSRRADIIVVTKCPATIGRGKMESIESKLKPNGQQTLFFSSYDYKELKPVFGQSDKKAMITPDTGILVVAGIVSPQPMIEYLRQFSSHIDSLLFPDHHSFSPDDIDAITKKIGAMNHTQKIIVVTEKDAARIISNPDYPNELKSKTFALPIQVKILDNKETLFTEKIERYVRENSRNR